MAIFLLTFKCGNAQPLSNPKHNLSTEIKYENGFALEGTKITSYSNEGCPLNITPSSEPTAPLFTFKGYSTNELNQICVGYIINLEAIDVYEANNGEAVFKYGFIASANDDTPLDELGNKENANALSFELTNEKYTGIDFKISGDWSDATKANALITMNIYTVLTEGENTTVSYIHGEASEEKPDEIISGSYEKADQISYALLNPPVVTQ